MGIYDEQIRRRILNDDEVFTETMIHMAGAVMGDKLRDALSNSRVQTKDSIDELLKFFHIASREVPDSIRDPYEHLAYLLRPSGIVSRAVKLDKGWYKDAVGPMLGVLKEDGQLVALLPGKLGGYTIRDARTGKRKRVNALTQGLIEDEALCFYRPFPQRSMSLMDLILYMVRLVEPVDLWLPVLATFLATMAGMLTPRLTRILYSDPFLTAGSLTTLVALGIFMFSASLGKWLIELIKGMVTTRVTQKLSYQITSATMMRLLSLPASFFRDYSAGNLSDRLKYMQQLAGMLVSLVLATGLSAVFSLIYINQIIYYTPALALPALGVIFVTAVLINITAHFSRLLSKKKMQISAAESGLSYSLISGVQKIRLSGSEKRAFAKWGRIYGDMAALSYNPPMIIRVNGVLNTAVGLIGTLVLYSAAIASGVNVADYAAFNTAYGMVYGAILSIANIVVQVAGIRPVLSMVRPILDAAPEAAEDKQVLESISGGIELNNISFRYREDMPPVLDDLSLRIRPGQYLAIVGRTGCGKSTLMRILLGFEKPQKGAVYYDGRDLTSLDLKSLRRKIGTVMQNGKVFMGSLYENIVIAAPQLTLDEAWEAAETAGLADDIRAMPMQMQTIVFEGGGGISGGQKQRLMIARAIAPKPKILMFDEATSALDNKTQKQVSDALDKLKCTRIVIAHRLSTIRNCDRIIVLDGGRIREDGTYEELIAQNGLFAELVARQRLEET